jgi:hypothetical protein
MGFPWRMAIGDWYVDPAGFCDLVRSAEDIARLGAPRGRTGHDVFLPSWDDCRVWLGDRGWGHPEVMHDGESDVTMSITHTDGRMLKTTGVSDLDCLYRFILLVQMRSPTRAAVTASDVSVLEAEPPASPEGHAPVRPPVGLYDAGVRPRSR